MTTQIIEGFNDAATLVANGDTGVSTPAVPKTRKEKLADRIEVLEKRIVSDTAELAEKRLQLESVDLLASVAAGSNVIIRVGRAETSREVSATILGVKTTDSGDIRYKASFGEGFDAEVVIIQESQIISLVS